MEKKPYANKNERGELENGITLTGSSREFEILQRALSAAINRRLAQDPGADNRQYHLAYGLAGSVTGPSHRRITSMEQVDCPADVYEVIPPAVSSAWHHALAHQAITGQASPYGLELSRLKQDLEEPLDDRPI